MYEIYEQLLQKHGVTSYKVCRDTGISQSVISAWKNGKSIPKRETMQTLAEYFGVTLDYLLYGTEAPAYYLNEETAAIAQEIFENPHLRALFAATRGQTPENVDMAAEMLRRFKKTNPGG